MPNKLRLAQHVVYASRAAKIAKASRLGIAASAVLTFVIFAISYYGQMVGNVTLRIDRLSQGAGITMYESAEDRVFTPFLRPTVVENADGMTSLCSTEYSVFEVGDAVCIPADESLGLIDGANNGTSHLEYTFYVENAGDRTVDMISSITVVGEAKGAIESIRIRILINGQSTTYARRQTSRGTAPGELEPMTSEFYSPTIVMNQTITEFKPGQVLKVTIVIWYEGEDADHNINILGGSVKLDMNFKIDTIYEEEQD